MLLSCVNANHFENGFNDRCVSLRVRILFWNTYADSSVNWAKLPMNLLRSCPNNFWEFVEKKREQNVKAVKFFEHSISFQNKELTFVAIESNLVSFPVNN